MAYGKRKRYSAKFVNNQPAYRKRFGGAKPSYKRRRTSGGPTAARALAGVQRLTRMIETKEACFKTTRGGNAPQLFAHNVPKQIDFDSAVANNLFTRGGGTDDPMGTSIIKMIGDSYRLQGMACKFFLENPFKRAKTFYRMMFLRGPRGATFLDLFKGCAANKMIDQFNSEKYRIIASKRVTVAASNVAAQASGVPGGEGVTNITTSTIEYGGIGTKVVSFWIPGSKIAKGGIINYENNSNDVKFYDYKWVMLCYDWNGTPETSFCGSINEGYVKIYFKDA